MEQAKTPIPPCRAHTGLQACAVPQAGDMSPETLASPLALPLKGREYVGWSTFANNVPDTIGGRMIQYVAPSLTF